VKKHGKDLVKTLADLKEKEVLKKAYLEL